MLRCGSQREVSAKSGRVACCWTGARGGPRVALQFGWSRRLPMMLQTEAAECGLTCLAMIANFHGHDVDLTGLRRRFSTSL